jgi:hypothetical protein
LGIYNFWLMNLLFRNPFDHVKSYLLIISTKDASWLFRLLD